MVMAIIWNHRFRTKNKTTDYEKERKRERKKQNHRFMNFFIISISQSIYNGERPRKKRTILYTMNQ
jgi:hypothetical protein